MCVRQLQVAVGDCSKFQLSQQVAVLHVACVGSFVCYLWACAELACTFAAHAGVSQL